MERVLFRLISLHIYESASRFILRQPCPLLFKQNLILERHEQDVWIKCFPLSFERVPQLLLELEIELKKFVQDWTPKSQIKPLETTFKNLNMVVF